MDKFLENSKEYLNKITELIFILEEEYERKGIRSINKKDVEVFQIYGKILYSLGEFSSSIIKALKNIEKEKIEEIKNFIENSTNFIFSQSKESFFREKPNTPVEKNFFTVDYPIYREAILFMESLEKKDIDKAIPHIYKFYFYLFEFFSFIYNKERNEGIFFSFKFNKRVAIRLLELILNQFPENIDTLGFRILSFKIRPILLIENLYLNQAIDEERKDKLETILKEKHLAEIYKELFLEYKKQENKNISIEPFSWKIANLIWYVGAILQDRAECISQICPSEEENLIKIIRGYITKLKDKIQEEINTKKRISFSLSKKSEFDGLFKYAFEEETKIYKIIFEDLIKEFKIDIQTIKNHSKTNNNNIININEDLINGFKNFDINKLNIRSRNEKDFKLSKILGNNPYAFIYLIYFYSKNLNNFLESLPKENINFVGFYSSGLFLLQTALKGFGKNNYMTWGFKVFPYIKTHPIHFHSHKKNDKKDKEKGKVHFSNFILGDESVKTGYTYSIYRYYLKSSLENHFKLFDTKNFVIWDFKNYLKIDSSLRYEAFCDLEFEKGEFHIKSKKLELKNEEENLKKFIENVVSIPNFDINTIKTAIKQQIESKKMEFLDFTWFLSDIEFAFFIANHIKNQIKAKIKNQNNDIFLYSPSSEGRALNFLIALLMIIDKDFKDKNIKIGINEEKIDSNFLIDISFNTGFSFYINRIGKLQENLSEETIKENIFKILNKDNIFTLKDILIK